jgi:hypothetical protein
MCRTNVGYFPFSWELAVHLPPDDSHNFVNGQANIQDQYFQFCPSSYHQYTTSDEDNVSVMTPGRFEDVNRASFPYAV